MSFPVLASSLELLRRVATNVPCHRLGAPTPCAQWNVMQVVLHAVGDQHAWASTVGNGAPPGYDPFAPPNRLDGGIDELVTAAIDAATAAWSQIGPADETVPTPPPPVPVLTAQLAAAACALDAAVHAWDIAVATGQPSPLTADLAGQVRPGADATAEPLRGFAYAAPLPDHPEDDPAASLLRYLRRAPEWTP